MYFASQGLSPITSVLAWKDTSWTEEELARLVSPKYAVFLQLCPRDAFLDTHTLAVRCERRPVGCDISSVPQPPFDDVHAGEAWITAARDAGLSVATKDLDRIACCAGVLDDSGCLPRLTITGKRQCLVLSDAFQTASLSRVLRLVNVAAEAGFRTTIDAHARCFMQKM